MLVHFVALVDRDGYGGLKVHVHQKCKCNVLAFGVWSFAFCPLCFVKLQCLAFGVLRFVFCVYDMHHIKMNASQRECDYLAMLKFFRYVDSTVIQPFVANDQ